MMTLQMCYKLLFLGIWTISTVSCQRWFNITPQFKTVPINNGQKAEATMQLEFNQLVANSMVMNVEITYFTIFRWQDNRFIRPNSTDPNKRYVTIYGNDPNWESVWVPDIYLMNEIPTGILDFTPSDSIRVYENGTLKMSKRHITTFVCRIRIFKVPMTHETCSMEFQSSSYTVEEMNLLWWSDNPIIYSPNFISIVSEIHDVETVKCSGLSTSSEEQRPCLYANILVNQVYKGFVVQVYLPSSAIVLMLWLGFWVSLREVSSRVRVVTTAFIATVTQMVATMVVFPDTVQMEPILIWTAFCLVMNLVAFIEFILVHNLYITRERKRKLKQRVREAPQATYIPSSSTVASYNESSYNTSSYNAALEKKMASKTPSNLKSKSNGIYPDLTYDTDVLVEVDPETLSIESDKATCCSRWATPYRVDKICMVLFMLIVFAFNGVYWYNYLS